MKYKVVLWDFDGTLADTSEGIFQSACAALEALGHPAPEPAVLGQFIGPPLYYSFRTFSGLDEAEALRAVELFRAAYNAGGIYLSRVYDGLEPLIRRMRGAGVKIGVATLKPEAAANLLLEHFGLSGLIDLCCGSVSDHSRTVTKAQLIRRALAGLGGGSPAVLIGDTVYDAQGARDAGIDFVAAAYGFGIGEAEMADSVFTARCAADLERFFFGE